MSDVIELVNIEFLYSSKTYKNIHAFKNYQRFTSIFINIVNTAKITMNA